MISPSLLWSADLIWRVDAQESDSLMNTCCPRCLSGGIVLDVGRAMTVARARLRSSLLMINAGRWSESSFPMTGPKSYQWMFPCIPVPGG